jgi:hypothetical protein
MDAAYRSAASGDARYAREERMLEGGMVPVAAILVLALSWAIVLGGSAYFNKNMT